MISQVNKYSAVCEHPSLLNANRIGQTIERSGHSIIAFSASFPQNRYGVILPLSSISNRANRVHITVPLSLLG